MILFRCGNTAAVRLFAIRLLYNNYMLSVLYMNSEHVLEQISFPPLHCIIDFAAS